MLGDLVRGCGLEYGVKECGVDVVDEAREVGFGPGARVAQCLECAVLKLWGCADAATPRRRSLFGVWCS